jgi:hypothetical protein
VALSPSTIVTPCWHRSDSASGPVAPWGLYADSDRISQLSPWEGLEAPSDSSSAPETNQPGPAPAQPATEAPLGVAALM